MQLKLLGAIIILIATTWIGFEIANKLSERPRQLRQLKVALQSLEAEIMYGHVALRDAATHLSYQFEKPLSLFFKKFAERLSDSDTVFVSAAWKESLDEIWKRTALRQGEYEVLLQFGETLGQHDREHQQKHIRLALAHLEREENDAIEMQRQYEKMVRSLGFLAGLLIVILLM
ncbi:stage III sporulation protein SpoIIIAB [Calidifontibacillus erzurumensis]|uniref:Stage III sporulation protein SpoAB n=1 Tax=Calidifontibacillus erzurumensis TaxID=2741433 RepID=A0A8J8KAS5_9BACI|nr:stage III sporulation protein SpoIIIAB [Calidifontibacillus erzurumensis]NSL50378.1 stage III sporulation protein SpoAB [Calidifontibacillus erzurumensis]